MTRLEGLARQWRPAPAPLGRAVDLDEPGTLAAAPNPWQSVVPDSGDPSPPARRVALGPWTAASVRGLVILLSAAVALSGWWWWAGRPQAVAVAPTVLATGAAVQGAADPGASPSRAPSATDLAPGSSGASAMPDVEVVVHVAGLVRRPGLVRLPSGSRVADAVSAAGGVTRPHAADSVNLARVLLDGEQIVVGSGVGGGPAGAERSAGGLTDVNTADASALELLPGVGPVLAERIIAWRTANGPFRSVDELGEVSGIGDAILELLRPAVRV